MGFYQRLKDLKEDADLTQKQVASLIGVSVNHYGKYERGETDLPLGKALILAQYYNVSLDYLTGRTNNKKGECSPDLSQDELILLSKYRRLSERSKGKHDILIDQLLDQQEDEQCSAKGTG